MAMGPGGRTDTRKDRNLSQQDQHRCSGTTEVIIAIVGACCCPGVYMGTYGLQLPKEKGNSASITESNNPWSSLRTGEV